MSTVWAGEARFSEREVNTLAFEIIVACSLNFYFIVIGDLFFSFMEN